jgi:uncharacterized SAM-binding protein YcdF (DUF218 family)
LLAFPDPFLAVRHSPSPCDAVVLLGGATGERDPVAAELFRKGFTKYIVVTGQGDCRENAHVLERRGVPTTAIVIECDSTSTQENAKFTVPILRKHGFTNVTLVTSWYHSRRSLSCFRKYAPEIEFRSVPAEKRHAIRYQLPYVAAEYAKILVYLFRFGIWPVGKDGPRDN